MDIRSEFPSHPGPTPEDGRPRTRSNAIVCIVLFSFLALWLATANVVAFSESAISGTIVLVFSSPALWIMGKQISNYSHWLTWWRQLDAFSMELQSDHELRNRFVASAQREYNKLSA